MALLDIKVFPDEVLKQVASEVTEFDDALRTFLDDMGKTMYANHGIGLAANQVGVLKRVIVIDVSPDQDTLLKLVNPVISCAKGKITSEEGCLSVPDYRDTVKRSAEIVVQAKDPFGNPIEIKADGLLSRCIQHEIDHLNGILFVDILSRLKRQLFRHWLKKQKADLEE